MCEPEFALENVWHVLDVLEGSPAESAGLVPYGDWIIGWSGGVLRAEGDFYEVVESVRSRLSKFPNFPELRHSLHAAYRQTPSCLRVLIRFRVSDMLHHRTYNNRFQFVQQYSRSRFGPKPTLGWRRVARLRIWVSDNTCDRDTSA
jgi:hypothetical protein